MKWTNEIAFFSARELQSQDDGTIRLDYRFAIMLPRLRWMWGKPLYPTSVCRTPSHNESVGGHPRSLHLTDNPYHPIYGTMAIDLVWPDDRQAFMSLVWSEGWSIGVHADFIHLDLRKLIGLQQTKFYY